MLGNCPDYLKPGLSLSDFKSVVDLISFLQCQRAEKKIVKVNQAMSFGQYIYIYIYRQHEQVASQNNQKDKLKTSKSTYPCRL